jgi:RNA polymerase sigma-70 factor (ECF subfamily)
MEAMTRTAAMQQADLLVSAAAGDELAFRRIIVSHHSDMRRVCLAISGDHTIAEEAVQAAWLVAWRKLGKVHSTDHLRPWLVSVAVNEAKHLLRSRGRRSEIEFAPDSSGVAPGGDPATGIDLLDLQAAVRRMHPDDRALLTMHYGMGFNASELAIATGRTPTAIRQRLKRLVDSLREDLTDG